MANEATMQKSDILTLVSYNGWANDRVRRAAAQTSAEQFTAPARVSHGSLRGALNHVYGTEHIWRMRFQEHVSPRALPSEADYPTLAAFQKAWEAEEKAWRDYLETLNDPAFEAVISYETMRGVPQRTPLWQIIAHVVNHGTQFRAEGAVVLTNYGFSPGDLDMIAYLREQ
jgi:uncharacterized damage-inducible protein DinB